MKEKVVSAAFDRPKGGTVELEKAVESDLIGNVAAGCECVRRCLSLSRLLGGCISREGRGVLESDCKPRSRLDGCVLVSSVLYLRLITRSGSDRTVVFVSAFSVFQTG